MATTPPTVRMTHPKVKKPADVPASAVPIHEKHGWKRVKPAPAAATAAKTPEAKPAPVKQEKKEDG